GVVPPCRAWCLMERFIWRHSGRLFSSPALHACFAARAPCRTLRRSLRRSMPCVWADAGTAFSNITAAANAAAALPREIRMLILLFAAASEVPERGRVLADEASTVVPVLAAKMGGVNIGLAPCARL